jgi:type IV pilus assembly protein PilA
MPISAQKNQNMSKSRPRCMALLFRKDRQGFTVLELLVVVLILGVLATIAMMLLLSFKEKGNVVTLSSDLTSAYKASVQYHMDFPSGGVTLDILNGYGYRTSKNVALSVSDGSAESLNITATHSGAAGVYQVDAEGKVSKQ